MMTIDDRHVAVLVRAMIAKHGHLAPKAAAARVLHWANEGDQVAAFLWFEIADRAATVMAHSNRGLTSIQ
jgi:hypothetical protein